MVVDAYITRSGVFQYQNSDGTVRNEYRPPEEVAKLDSLDSFKMVPVTNDHPAEMLTSKNATNFIVGSTGQDVVMDGDLVRAPIAIFDEATIRDIQNGKREVSCGYRVDMDPTAGVTPSGEKYDAIQRNIRGNHVAIVRKGRAGPQIKVRMDQAIMIDYQTSTPSEDETMENDTLQFEKAKEQLRADQAEAEVSTLKTQAEVLTAERDDARDKLELAEASAVKAEEARADAINHSVALRLKAMAVLPASDKLDRFDGLSDRDIKLAVIEHLSGKKLDADKSDEYVEARFDAATEDVKPTEDTKVKGRIDVAESPSTEKDLQAKQRLALRNLNPFFQAN